MSILCLHGYLQSGKITEKAIKRLLPKAQLICPDGPFDVNSDEKSGYGWWPIADKLDLTEPPTKEQIEQCLEYGRKIFSEINQPEIAIGFSQGASCVTLWIQEGIINPKKVILLSNFAIKKYLNKVHPIFSLHIYGENDTLLSDCFPSKNLKDFEEYSLCPYYSKKTIYRHRWGHVIPSDGATKTLIREFLM